MILRPQQTTALPEADARGLAGAFAVT